MSVMIGSVTERLAPDSDFMMPGNDTNITILDTNGRDAERVKIAATVTFLSGIFQVGSLGIGIWVCSFEGVYVIKCLCGVGVCSCSSVWFGSVLWWRICQSHWWEVTQQQPPSMLSSPSWNIPSASTQVGTADLCLLYMWVGTHAYNNMYYNKCHVINGSGASILIDRWHSPKHFIDDYAELGQ